MTGTDTYCPYLSDPWTPLAPASWLLDAATCSSADLGTQVSFIYSGCRKAGLHRRAPPHRPQG